jgi:hypothetical protein
MASDGSYAVFSPLGGIEKDLGVLNVVAPGYTPPPPPPSDPEPCEPVFPQVACAQ